MKVFIKKHSFKSIVYSITLLFTLFSSQISQAQCTPQDGTVQGFVYEDRNNNGTREGNEKFINNVLVSLYNQSNQLVSFTNTNIFGEYSFNGLPNGENYRLGFEYLPKYVPSYLGVNNQSNVQLITVPTCSASFGLITLQADCGSNAEVFTTCFVQGSPDGSNGSIETIIGFESNFNNSSAVNKYAVHSETGPVWGLAWKSSTGDLFSSAFVKQYGTLTSHGHGAIFKTKVNGNTGTTSLFTKMSDLGIDVGALEEKDANNCTYGNQVGKYGLGAMVMGAGEDFLYVVNLYKKSIVKIPTSNPKSNNVEEILIPDPGCSNGDYAPFALKMYNDKLYVGVTCTEETGGSDLNSSAVVYEFDLVSKTFNNIFSTNYLKGHWTNEPAHSIETQHWFTDIDFTDNGNMVIAFTDRIGHKYCYTPNRLDHQYPDILMVWNDNGVWKLESNGSAGSISGTGVGNGQGPDNGEFFGEESWVTQPLYHPEIALGSILVIPGSNAVITAAFDPGINSYSGGVQKYNTKNGEKISFKELYVRQTTTTFGKATGFGDLIGRCGLPKIQVGNLAWFDDNKNGIQDAGENPAPKITLNLYDANCVNVGSTTTDENGQYVFSDLTPGVQYYIGLSQDHVNNPYNLISLNNENYIFSPDVTNKLNIDNNAHFNSGTCSNAIIPFNHDKTNHNLDIGLVKAEGFDLALKNEILTNDYSRYNDMIDFKITVFNQGGIPAKNIKIANYIPDGFIFDSANNPGWNYQDKMAMTLITETVLPGGSISRTIKLKLINNDINKLVDVAEIVSATDHNGDTQTDVDSTPDATPNNDTGGDVNTITDNVIDDNGTVDEDDQDPATPKIIDLALKQELADECFVGGDCFEVKITVYNQGNVTISSFDMVNYLGPLLSFDKLSSTGWSLSNESIYYTGPALNPGQSVVVPIYLCVKDGVLNHEITNYAEISQIKVNGSQTGKDFDSNPDNNVINDAGGVPVSADDNNINGIFGIEEDDHDPIFLGVKYVDVALKLTTESRKVEEGETVCFDITIYNQGTETLKSLKVVDYIPQGLTLISPNWTILSEKSISKLINFPDGFRAGQEYVEKVCFKVGNLDNIFYIENNAEIQEIIDVCAANVSLKDIDSKADEIKSNDVGGHPQTVTDNLINGLPSIDEDDADPALLINYITILGDCDCLGNATNSSNGQFQEQISITGPPGMTWYIDEAVNIYSIGSLAPPALPTPFVTGPLGYILNEVPINAFASNYYLTGIFEDGQLFTIILKSTGLDFEIFHGGGCTYDAVPVSGTNSLCSGLAEVYSVPFLPLGYSVSLSGGGTIIASSPDSSIITIQWGVIPGTYSLTFAPKDPNACKEPGVMNIAIGNPHAAMACKGDIQVSLDADCSVEITPAMIVAGTLAPDAPYTIMLTDDKGNVIPGNLVNASHIGKMVIAKLIEGCGGNSCWGKVKVEDKTGPIMNCKDTVEVLCYKMDEYPGPISIDNCGGKVKINTLDSLVTVLYCHPDYTTFVNKTYQAVDAYGNKSPICKQVLAVKRMEIDSIDFPADIEMANALSCNEYEVDEFGFPSPNVTGNPSIEGYEIYPTFDKACNLGVSYTDRDFGYIGCTRKIMRVWTVFEWWCNRSVIKQDTQTIIIADLEVPEFTCPPAITVSTGHADCEGLAIFPPLTGITDDCSLVFDVDIKYPGGFISTNGGSASLPLGSYKIKYIVYDECLNRDSCNMTVTVVDKTPPTSICDRNTTVAINSLGKGYVYASTIDDGSYDACGLDSMRIRRMDSGQPCGHNFGFRTIADFCCADVGKEVMLEFKVWDRGGNANSCMVNVLVQDKTLPEIKCPKNVSISCEVDYDLKNLSQYGVATAVDACGATLKDTAIAFVNQCRVGYIERIFTASDKNGFVRCTSYIFIEKTSGPLIINWPLDYETNGRCSPLDLDPSKLPAPFAKPTFNDGVCDLVAASKEDAYFPFDDGQGSCYKILREWTVIDWCRKDEEGYEPATWQQVIKVSNNVDPTIEIDAMDEACTDEDNCDEGFIELFAEGSDDCTPDADMFWRYEIDLDFDGSFEADIDDSGFGNEIDASGIYDVGNHRILFTFEDRCGNQITELHDFEIQNCELPSPVCINGTSISLGQMVINGQTVRMACITAASLNQSSSHPCDLPLKYSFSTNVSDTIKCFDCSNLGRTDVILYVTDEAGNVASCSTFVDVQNNEPGSFTIEATDDVVCNGQPTTLTVVLNGMNGTFKWSTGAMTQSITVNPTVNTTYGVSVTTSDFCTLSESISISVNPLPVGLINTTITGNLTICAGTPTTLTASGGISYLWSTGATSAAITVSPTTTTNYIVTVTDGNGCTATANKNVIVNPLPNPVISPGVATICVGNSINLIAAGGINYLWSPGGATTNQITVSPTTTTTYTVTVTNANGCTASTSRIVTVNPLPNASTTATATTICVGASTTITASGGGTYLWSPGGATTSAITVSPTVTTTYTVTVTGTNSCTATATRTITVNPLPSASINAVPGFTICLGGTTTLSVPLVVGNTYLWSPGGATTNSIAVSPLASGPSTYSVTVTGSNGCSATSSAVVNVNPKPVVNITGDNSICPGESTTLTANVTANGPATAFSWSPTGGTPNATSATYTVAPTTNTTYTVTVTNANTCTNTASINVVVNPAPQVGITGDLSICVGESTTLTASGGGSYIWSNGQTTAAINVSPTTTTSFTVTVTGTNTCTASATAQVVVTPLPTANISANPGLTICAGNTTTLTASGGGTYLWSPGGATSAAIVVSPTTNTTYTVTVTNNGCAATSSATVVVNQKPVLSITGDNTVCPGMSTTLTATVTANGPITNYLWAPGGATTMAITVTPTTATTYAVTVTNTNGCTNTSTLNVVINPVPTASISGDLSICLGESTTLTASGGVSFLWNPGGATTAAITVSPTATTTYTVTVTNADGCTDTESVNVSVNTNNNPIAMCKNITVYLGPTGQITITGADINNNSQPGCNNAALTFTVNPNFFACNNIVTNPNTVVLTVTSSTGNSATCSATVTVLDTLKPVIVCPPNLTINCANFNGLGGLPSATATDNCMPAVVTVQVLSAVNVCNIGTFTRTFTAKDASLNMSMCSQLITVTPSTDPLTAADIVFPANVTVNNCVAYGPSVAGSPIVNSQNATCTKISVNFVDNIPNPTPCSFVVQRTWTVIDSCQLNGSGAGIFSQVQLITVNDNMPPTISGYIDITVNTPSCPAQVTYPMGGVSITDCSNFTVTNNSPFATNNNSGNPSGMYDDGTTTVIVTAMDNCGNMAKDTFTITVIGPDTFSFVCQKLIRNITDQDFVKVNVFEHLQSFNPGCFNLVPSYSNTNMNDSVRIYTCANIGDTELTIFFFLDGVKIDSCKTLTTILDPAGFCNNIIFRATGAINTENSVPVKDVSVNLTGMQGVMTDKDGKYAFPAMIPNGDYMITPRKDDGILEGVSTMDLILIQRHILGSTKLNSPYKMIAADVNNDNKISVADLVELRKVILGFNTKFKNNTSWKTIDERYDFADPKNPFNNAYPLYHEFIQPQGSMIADFVGVKIGDVNDSYTASANNRPAPSNTSILLDNVLMNAGETTSVPVRLKDVEAIDGLQLIFDIGNLVEINVGSDLFDQNELHYSVEGSYLIVLLTPTNIVNTEDRIMFNINGISLHESLASNSIRLINQKISSEVYSNNHALSVRQEWNNADLIKFALGQNIPNPWDERTAITYTMPQDGNVVLSVKEVDGRVIFQKQLIASKGNNQIEIKDYELRGKTGVLLYELNYGNETLYGKMIRIK